ncbi:MAG: cytochrome c [Rhodospirillales bacterium]|nr:cytochrome c [Rhodospirillales bacterium]
MKIFCLSSRTWLCVAILSLALFAPVSAKAELSDERKSELAYFLEQDCGSCHGLTRQGGLGSPLTPETVAETDDETLFDVIMNGIPGTPMPSWKPLFSQDEVHYLIKLIRKGKDYDG